MRYVDAMKLNLRSESWAIASDAESGHTMLAERIGDIVELRHDYANTLSDEPPTTETSCHDIQRLVHEKLADLVYYGEY